MPFVFNILYVRRCSTYVEGAFKYLIIACVGSTKLRRRRVEYINFIPQACKVSRRHFVYFKDFSTVKQNGYWLAVSLYCSQLLLRIAGMVSKAVFKMCWCFHTCWMTRFNNYVSDWSLHVTLAVNKLSKSVKWDILAWSVNNNTKAAGT